MERVFVRQVDGEEIEQFLRPWLKSTLDGDLFDLDILEHGSTIVLGAFTREGIRAFLPIQQPLMLENFVLRPGLSEIETVQVMARLGEHAVEEAYHRDAGEAYFLCRDRSTLQFAERHLFRKLPEGLEIRRLNLLETFGN